MRKPRALHVAAGNLYGGVERILVEIARAPASWRHEFAICFEGRLSRELDDAGAERHLLGDARFSRPWSVWRARRRLRQINAAGKYDAVVCHSPWPYALAAPALDGPPVLWAHDALRGTHWTEERVARRPPPFIICNSRYTEAAIGAWLPGVPRTVVYAPVSAPVSTISRHDIRRAFGVDDDVVVVAMASRFERWKGHAELLRAAARLDRACEVWIAGVAQRPPERDYQRELERLTGDLGLSARVRFLQDRVNVPDLFAASDVHCQANTAPEPFGIAFVEALYARVPVLTSDAGGAKEIVTSECGVLVPMGDATALAEALHALVARPDVRTALGAAGPARARLLCDPSARMAQLESALLRMSGTAA